MKWSELEPGDVVIYFDDKRCRFGTDLILSRGTPVERRVGAACFDVVCISIDESGQQVLHETWTDHGNMPEGLVVLKAHLRQQ